ncbi:ABC transporter permease [Dyadobacter psychrotolerans]|uniref:ABC transporter permease n=1 Tax=Dyadobacter psychrotolerans TaxID=2541721 RepID=A0A4R5DU41_9BACT|nr:ABC transporter permease [Dyadobacter psychrotolerans]TDE14433.1 ABC transporter permease [Dyadobacter psychrotolerans]
MIKSYLKIALRNLWKNKLFSLINVFGLASGLMVCLLAIAHIKGAYDYDNFHPYGDRIFRVFTDVKGKDNSWMAFATAPAALSASLKQDYSFIESSTRLKRTYGEVSANNKRLEVLSFAADTSFYQIFGYPLSSGRTAAEPGTAVITQETAEKFFGKVSPIGKVIHQYGNDPAVVTGIFAKTTKQSHLKFDILFSLNDDKMSYDKGWEDYGKFYTYVLLKPGTREVQLEKILPGIAGRATKSLKQTMAKAYGFRIQALNHISPSREELAGSTYEPPMTGLMVEMIVGLVTLLMAAFNYINLTLARSMSRAREVGIRKTSGALRWQLLGQFMAESVVLSLFSLSLAWLMLELVKPMAFVQQWLISGVVWDWQLWAIFVAFSVVAGLLAGIVPARVLSGLQPAEVLRSHSGIKVLRGISLKNTLIVVQFSISLIAMIALVTMMRQHHYMATADYGFRSRDILNIPLNGLPYDRLANEVNKIAGVEGVSGTSELFGSYGNSQSVKWQAKGADSAFTFNFFVANDFVKTMNLNLAAGEDVQERDRETGRMVLINEEAVKKFRLGTNRDAVGKSLWLNDSTEVQIAGVVKDFRFTSFSTAIKPLILTTRIPDLSFLSVAVTPNTSESVLKEVKQIWKRLKPYEPFDGQWYADYLYNRHSHAEDMSFMALLIGLSFSIACLGLLGMVTYNTQTRIKEVGIRKVMGAEVKQIIWLLSQDFVLLLSIAGGIALPLGYLAGYAFLFNFAYHVSIGFETLGLCFAVLLILGALIIITRTYKAAIDNPVKSLGSE